MDGYLGEFPVDINDTEYATYTKEQWAIHWIAYYGQFDGGHHKQWTLDQVSRILHGTPVVVMEAKWSNGHSEYRFGLGKASDAYEVWAHEMLGDELEDGSYEYDYDTGTPP